MKLRMFSLFLCFFIFMSSFTSFADISETEPVKSWQEAVDEVKAQRATASASEADSITMDLTDDDYGIMPLSSLGTVSNTVDRTGIQLVFFDSSWRTLGSSYILSDGTIPRFVSTTPIRYVYFVFLKTSMPPSGVYDFSCDFSSDISFDLSSVSLSNYRDIVNAQFDQKTYNLSSSQYDFLSGDLYIAPITVSLNNQNSFRVVLNVKGNDLFNFSGSARFKFTRSSSEPAFSGIGTSSSDIEADYQAGVTSSLGNIGDTLEEIVETISLQLDALWNQMYNYIHLPEYEKLEQIRQAIENLDLNIDVDQSELIAKIQEQIENDNANTDRLINSYDNSGLTQSNDDLNQSIDDYDSQEQEVMDQVSGYVSDFEYESYFDKFTAPMSDISYFLTGIYEGLAGLNIPIGFSLTLMIALICIGFYRFKGGG